MSDWGAVLAVCTTLALWANVVARQPGTVATVWLANGAATALIVSAPRRRFPWLLLAFAGSILAANVAAGDTLLRALAFMPGNVLEVALAVVLTRSSSSRFADDPASFMRVLLSGAVVPPLLGACVGNLVLDRLGFASSGRVLVDWYVGSLLGSVVTLSLGLSLRGHGLGKGLRRAVGIRFAGTLFVTLAGGWMAYAYLPYPLVAASVWLMFIALTESRLATFANAFALVLVLMATTGWKVFVPLPARGALDDALLYLTHVATVLPPLWTAVMMSRKRTLSQMLDAVSSRTDDIAVLVDMQGTCRWVSDAHGLYWGRNQPAPLGRPWLDAVGLPPGPESKRLIDQALAGHAAKALHEVDFPLRGRRWMEVSTFPSRDEDGRQTGVLLCSKDTTDLVQTQRELQRNVDQLRSTNAQLQHFVHIASHDLREPMNSIEQFIRLIEQDSAGSLDPSVRLYFMQVREGALRMRTMLDDILQLAQLDSTVPPIRELVDLDGLVREVQQVLHARLAERGARIVVEPLGTAWGQRGLLLLVLQNLLSNAVKFVPADRHPQVRIRTRQEGELLRLEVEDNGIGISADKLPLVGQPFRRLHSRRKFDGTGLGLAICRRIAEQHGGTLEIESRPEIGSCFAIVLPQRLTPR